MLSKLSHVVSVGDAILNRPVYVPSLDISRRKLAFD